MLKTQVFQKLLKKLVLYLLKFLKKINVQMYRWKLIIKFAFTGPFIGVLTITKIDGCGYSHAIGSDEDNKELSGEGKEIGVNPETKNKVFLRWKIWKIFRN